MDIGELKEKRRKRYHFARSIRDYGFGFIIFAFGILFLFHKELYQLYNKVGLTTRFDDPVLMKSVGVIFIIYGLFRIYRGYKKNYD